ncbi:MAG: hypothetical protein K0R57_2078 [Paenibacillaceae bacterium]|nr:hypothetical protein [Paenibacillaceae bacterium]
MKNALPRYRVYGFLAEYILQRRSPREEAAIKRITDPTIKQEILERIEQLTPAAVPLWGRMNVNQMICHLSDQLKDMAGTRVIPDQSNFIMAYIAKPVAFYLLPRWPKGKLPTAPGYDAFAGGTKPTAFGQDKEELLRLYRNLVLKPGRHPAFGPMTVSEYGRVVYKHFDHHLRQFGV